MPYRTVDDRIDGLVVTFTDITVAKSLEMELKKTNEALRISDILYHRLFESSKDGLLVIDAETGIIQNVNPFLIELLGYAKEQFIAKTIWETGFFKDIAGNREKFSEMQHKDFVHYKDLSLETGYGRKINVEFISNVYLVSDKKVIQCQIRDVES